MKMYLTVNNGVREYLVSRKIDIPTSGDFFNQLFRHRDTWEPTLTLWLEPFDGREPVSLGTLESLYEQPLIRLCKTIGNYYGINRMRTEQTALAAKRIPTLTRVVIEKSSDYWR